MELIYRGSFRRDYKKIKNRQLIIALKGKINEIKTAKNTSQISHLKKLRLRKNWCKIEVNTKHRKIYWILCIISGKKIEFVRVKSESHFKKNL